LHGQWGIVSLSSRNCKRYWGISFIDTYSVRLFGASNLSDAQKVDIPVISASMSAKMTSDYDTQLIISLHNIHVEQKVTIESSKTKNHAKQRVEKEAF